MIKIPTTLEVSAPKGTKVILNDDWVTLARKSEGNIKVFTCRKEDIHSYDLNNEDNWTPFTKEELKTLAAL